MRPKRTRLLLLVVILLNLMLSHTTAGQSPVMVKSLADTNAKINDVKISTVILNGATIAYQDTGGNGIPVVFLHAATGSIYSWEYQLPAFAQAGYRFIAYDRRGHGRSVNSINAANAANLTNSTNLNPKTNNSTSPDNATNVVTNKLTAADDLHALMQHLGITRFHLVSTAAGGSVAFDYALSFPSQVRSLVIANSLGGVQDESYLELGRRLRPPQFAALPADLRELGPAYRAANPTGTQRWLETVRQSRPEGASAVPLTYRNTITFNKLAEIKLPTLFITGSADLYIPPTVLPLFLSKMPHAESLVVPEVGHSTYWEQPAVFNQAVLRFIQKYNTP